MRQSVIPNLRVAAMLLALTAGPASAERPSGAPATGAWGINLADQDHSARPGEDFYRWAVGAGVNAMVVPPDRGRYGASDALAELSNQRVRAILEDASKDRAATGDAASLGAFYRAFMDESRIETLGASPLRRDLSRIRRARTRAQIAALMGSSPYGYFGGVFDLGVVNDFKAPDRYAVLVGTSGLTLPDRDYYLDPKFAAQKAKFQIYVAKVLAAVKWPRAEQRAAEVVALQTRIAQVSWTRAEHRNPTAIYNPMSPADLSVLAPGFAWTAFLDAAGVGSETRIVVIEKSAFPKVAAIFAETPVETLQALEAFTLADQAAPYLSRDFADAHFEFHAKALSGQLEQKPRWKRAAIALDERMGEAIGKVYVERWFPADSKTSMQALIGELRAALAERIRRLDWMSEGTKTQALNKLSQLRVKVGYPDRWRDYSSLRISDHDLYGDVQRAIAFEWRRRLSHLHDPVDHSEWGIHPQTVNAYYSPLNNEIVFPAAILQPPFFDPKADAAVNFGGIGSVIGHEMTHGFDDQGRQFDGTGALADWWAPRDSERFKVESAKLGAQYDGFEPVPGTHVKGAQTMGENIADLGGLLVALDAYRASLRGKPAPVLDGLSGDQRVFLAQAQLWKAKVREDEARRLAVSDPHSPPRFRVIGPDRNIDAWYEAFAIKPGDPLYLPPEQRVRIW